MPLLYSCQPTIGCGTAIRCGAALFLVISLAVLICFNGTAAREVAQREKAEYRFALSEDEWPQCVAFSPDNRKIYAGTNAGRLWSWELNKKSPPKRIRLTSGGLLTGSVDCLAISPDGRKALAGCADSKVRVVDLDEIAVSHVLQGHSAPVFSVAFDRDGQRALTGSSGDKIIILWDLKTGKLVRRYEGEEIVHSLALSTDGGKFLTTEFKSVQEWDLHSGKRLRSLKGHKYRVHAVFYSPDGGHIVSGGYDTILVWDAKTGKCVRSVGDGKFNAESFALSPDGRHILVGGAKEMHLLDVKENKTLKRWKGLEGNVHVAFSPDGSYALSGEEQGAVSLWKLPMRVRKQKGEKKEKKNKKRGRDS